MNASDARARSLASSVHLRAFASLAALERHELDATEHLSDARRVALATIAAVGAQRVSLGRALAVFISLLMAAGILIAVVAPSATVVLAANASPLGPSEYDLRAGPNGDIKATSQTVPVTAKSLPFTAAFSKKYGNFPSYAGYTSYDEVYYIADAVKRARACAQLRVTCATAG